MSSPPTPDTVRTFALPAILDLHAVAALLPALRDAAAIGRVRLDGAAVERVGQAGLQLLLSATHPAAASATLVACSAALRRAAELAGVDHLLGTEEGQAA